MKLTSILAIYALFWTLSLFVILPIGVKTSEEMGEERGKGHADSAPHRSEEQTSELQSLISISYAVLCLKKKKKKIRKKKILKRHIQKNVTKKDKIITYQNNIKIKNHMKT